MKNQKCTVYENSDREKVLLTGTFVADKYIGLEKRHEIEIISDATGEILQFDAYRVEFDDI